MHRSSFKRDLPLPLPRFTALSSVKEYEEPLTPPLLRAAKACSFFEAVSAAQHSERLHPGINSEGNGAIAGAETDRATVTDDRVFNSTLDHNASPSTINALAAVALATSPPISDPLPRDTRHSSSASTSQWHSRGFCDSLVQAAGSGYDVGERPPKRARSEVLPSPQFDQHEQRFASVQVAVDHWPHIADERDQHNQKIHRHGSTFGTQLSNDAFLPAQKSDAELLLGFALASHTSPPAYTKRVPVFTPVPAGSSLGRVLLERDHSIMAQGGGSSLFNAQDTHSGTTPSYVDPIARAEKVESFENGIRSGHDMERGLPVNNQVSTATPTQTQTPPDLDSIAPITMVDKDKNTVAPKKTRVYNGWPKGKPRGVQKRAPTRRKTIKNKTVASSHGPNAVSNPPDTFAQLPSPKDSNERGSSAGRIPSGSEASEASTQPPVPRQEHVLHRRRYSVEELPPRNRPVQSTAASRSSSVPLSNLMTIRGTVCAGCKFSSNTLDSEGEKWISCNGCKKWYHFACAGFRNEREVRNVDKFFCRPCKPGHGATTFVRKSARAHTSVDYAGLNEGVLRTSEENPEHHYIAHFKEGRHQFQPETFPRMRPELLTAEYLERCGGMTEPIVIPAEFNPRPKVPRSRSDVPLVGNVNGIPEFEDAVDEDWLTRDFEYESVPDDGQDKLDMVIPQGLTVRTACELYGLEEKVEVINVKSQEGEDKRWNLKQWADYYETQGEKPVRNVISLEVSTSKLGRLIRRPKVVRDLDLQDSVWPEEETMRGIFPKVQFYCLMSVADCYTDFHIDFGGSSVYYHILKGKKTFFFIPPKPKHLKKYEQWCLSPAQNWTFLPDQTRECYRVDLSEGDTMLIPSGWIHAVWTPENSLVIGGNFLTRMHYQTQFKVADIEKTTKVGRKFRYPHFQKVMWYTVLRYLEQDPLPPPVAQGFYEGRQYYRAKPIYLESDSHDPDLDSDLGMHNARYYSQAELEGLPGLTDYIFRTVMISLGKVDGITMDTRNAVSRSIPKGHGDPLEVAKTFAMWAAWKRGNEDIPQWAHPEAVISEADEEGQDKKLSARQLKELERRNARTSWSHAPDRQSARQASKAASHAESAMLANGRHHSTPKTSVLGPKRVACDGCRKRRIRCKHKDNVSGLADPSGHTATESGACHALDVALPELYTMYSSSNRVTGSTPLGERRNSKVLSAVVIDNSGLTATSATTDTDNRPHLDITASTQQPRARNLSSANSLTNDSGNISADYNGKRGRTKACLECHHQRRCIHYEDGRIDLAKAAEPPVPRGSMAAKKRSTSGHVEAEPIESLIREQPSNMPPMLGPAFKPNMMVPTRAVPPYPAMTPAYVAATAPMVVPHAMVVSQSATTAAPMVTAISHLRPWENVDPGLTNSPSLLPLGQPLPLSAQPAAHHEDIKILEDTRDQESMDIKVPLENPTNEAEEELQHTIVQPSQQEQPPEHEQSNINLHLSNHDLPPSTERQSGVARIDGTDLTNASKCTPTTKAKSIEVPRGPGVLAIADVVHPSDEQAEVAATPVAGRAQELSEIASSAPEEIRVTTNGQQNSLLEQSSPTIVSASDSPLQSKHSQRQSRRQSKPVDRYSSATYPSAATARRTSTSHTTGLLTNGTTKSSGSPSADGTSTGQKRKRTSLPSVKREEAKREMSMAEMQEEESLKLARVLMDEDRGLRRRGRQGAGST
ncbi:hypothetical protein B0A49_06009 [Cryomyces minteri]|uniref:JmjC domain-containing histone demethylation protein 1 n=1 Tax=Cryomyces minteri TaxID=331657 RepID=A0A4U0X6X8_9PEZI|nr:hypothetical protein B0A49_06009 [Cryomyces minteri]